MLPNRLSNRLFSVLEKFIDLRWFHFSSFFSRCKMWVCVEWCARDRTNWIWIAFPMKNFLFVYSVVAPSVLVLFYIRQTMRTWLTGCRHLTLLSTRHLQTLSEKTFSHKNIFIWKITPFISFFYLKPWMFKKEKKWKFHQTSR